MGWHIIRSLQRQEKATVIHLCNMHSNIQQIFIECLLEYFSISKDRCMVRTTCEASKAQGAWSCMILSSKDLFKEQLLHQLKSRALGTGSIQRSDTLLLVLCSALATCIMTYITESWMLGFRGPLRLVLSTPPPKNKQHFLGPRQAWVILRDSPAQ